MCFSYVLQCVEAVCRVAQWSVMVIHVRSKRERRGSRGLTFGKGKGEMGMGMSQMGGMING